MFQRRSAKKKAARKNNKTSRRLAAVANPPLFAHLAFEPLEERRMLANNVTASVTAGTLNISFTASDTAQISTSAGNVVVTDVGTSATVLSTAETGVNSIVVTSGTGTDLLTVTSALTWSNLASFSEGAGLSSVTLSANVTTTGTQTYNDPVTLGAASVTLTSTSSGAISLDNTVTGTTAGADALSVSTAGTMTFGNTIGATSLASLSASGGGTIDLNAGSVTTSGGQTYSDAVALGANTTLTSTSSGTIDFGSTVNGADSLSVSTSGTITFSSTVGSGTPLTSLTTSAGSTAQISGNVTTTNGAGAGNQTYNGAVVLEGSSAIQFKANGSSATTVTFGSSVSDAATAVPTVTGAGSTAGVSLSINALTSSVTTSPTTILVNSSSPVEPTINFASLAGITLTNTGTAGLTVDGASGGSNTLTLNRVSASNDTYAFASGPTVTFPFGNSIAFSTSGDGNNNTLDIVRSATNGDPVSTANGASFTGGSGTGNTLSISGSTVTNLVYNATGAGAGNVSLDGAKTTFTGLQPVTVTSTPTNVTINVTDTVSHKIALGAASPPVTGESEVTIDGGFESMTFTNPTTSLSLTGTGHADTITLNTLGSGFSAGTIGLTDGSGAEFDIEANPSSATTTVSSNVATLTSAQTLYVGSTSSTFNTGTGSLANIAGTIDFTAGSATSGSQQLYVDDSSDTTARTVTLNSAATPNIAVSGITGVVNYSGGQTNVVQFAGGTGGNTFTVTSTTGGTVAQPATTTIFGGDGTGTNTNTFNVSVPGLAGSNVLEGEGVASVYNINFTGGSSIASGTLGPAGANLTITGHTGGTSSHRDTVNLNAQSGAGGRTVGFNYQAGATGSSIQVTGLGTTAGHIAATSIQQVDYNGATAGDNLTVTGPTTASDITVAPQSSTSALVFLGATGTGAGAGWAGPPAAYATTFPGIDGGSLAPDLFLKGSTTGGLLVNGGATNNDQLTVYAPSETSVFDAATTSNPFGFGTGVIVPATVVSSNTIHVSDAVGLTPPPAPAVQISNSALGTLLPVGIGSDAPFVQTTTPTVIPGLIVNTGGTADNVTVTPSANFKIQVNEVNPTPNNDTITIVTPAALDIWSNAATPPVVTAGGSGTYGVGYTNFSNVDLAPGNGVVNVFGNNNDATTPQFDYDQVVGTALGAFTLTIGASTASLAAARTNLAAPINLSGVTTLNVFGGPNLPGNPAVPVPPLPTSNYPDTDTNELNITPWANNTPEGWGIQTYFNQGNSSADDLLVYNGTAGISENIAIQPSGQGQGQVYATNPAAGNSSIAIVNYSLNTDIEVNGTNSGTGEIDNLTLYGTKPANGNTSGSDTFTADFGGPGTAADPYVSVNDSANFNSLYNLLNMSNINTVTMNGLGGADTFNIDSFFPTTLFGPSGPQLYVDGGATGSGAATVNLDSSISNPSASAVYGNLTYTPGSSTGSGTLQQQNLSTFVTNTLTFRNTQTVNINGDGTANESELFVNGIGNGDKFRVDPIIQPNEELVPAADSYESGSGVAQVDSYTPVNFFNFGNGTATVALDAVGSTANFNITPMPGIATITANGDVNQPQSNTVTVNGLQAFNAVTVSPTSITTATVAITGLATVDATAAGSLVYNGQDFGDTLAVVPPGPGTNMATYTPGNAPDAGSFQINNLIPFSYVNLGLAGSGSSVTYGLAGNTDTLTIQGTSSNDTFLVNAATGITLNSQLPIATLGTTALVLNGNGGVDTFNITEALGALPYTAGIAVNAAGAAGDDPLNVTGPGTNVTIGVTLNSQTQTQTITGLGGPISVTGVGTVNINGGGGVTDTLTVTSAIGNASLTYTPTGVAAGTFTAANIFPVFNFSAITSTFTVAGVAGTPNSLTVNATANNDTVVVNANNVTLTNGAATVPGRSVSVFNSIISATPLKQVVLDTTVQTLTVQGGLGSNSFLVIPDAHDSALVSSAFTLPTNLLVNIVGGPIGATNDSLVVAGYNVGAGGVLGTAATLPAADFAVVDRQTTSSGVVRMFASNGGGQPNQFPDIDYSNVAIVQPDVVTTGLNSQSLVLGPDLNQPNSSLNTATYLGTGSSINANNLTIFPNAVNNSFIQADQSFFRVVAQQTGTMDFDVYFNEQTNFLPNNGELQILVYDQNGNQIGSSYGAGNGSGHVNLLNSNGQRVRIPVVAGETYYLRVFGLANSSTLDTYDSGSLTINGYNLSITNTPAPTPYDIQLNTVVAQGSATAASTTSVTGASLTNTATTSYVPLSNTAGFYVGQYMTFADTATDGAVLGQTALITAYSGASHIFTLQAAGSIPGIGLSVAPPVGAKFQIESTDTGRSQLDSVTRINTPTVYINLADSNLLDDLTGGGTNSNTPPIGTIPITYDTSTLTNPPPPTGPQGYRLAIFDDSNSLNPVLVGYATPVTGLQSVYSFTFTTPLTDGVHYFTSEVQMVTQTKTGTPTVANLGFGGSSTAFVLDVDTQTPLIYFGSTSNGFDGLAAQSQNGGPNETRSTTPTFYGVAEADAIINVYALSTATTASSPPVGTPILLGQGQATPTDGTNQDPTGAWSVTSLVSLNNPQYFTANGNRTIEVTATDPAGNISTPVAPTSIMTLLLVTEGPQITSITIPTAPNFPLFAPKPEAPSPTPLITSLNIVVTQYTLPPGTIAQGAVDAGSTTTTIKASSLGGQTPALNTTPGYYVGQYLTLTSTSDLPTYLQTALITGYTGGASPTFTLATPLPAVPATGDDFQVQALPPAITPTYYTTGAGTVNAGATTTSVTASSLAWPATPLSSTNNAYVGQFLVVSDASYPGGTAMAQITAYNGTTHTFTLAAGLPSAPAAGDSFLIQAEAPPGYEALLVSTAQDVSNYSLVGKTLGPITIESATVTSIGLDAMGNPTATVTLMFASPLKNDIYTLTVSDALTDTAGNQLLGDVTQTNPDGSPIFPTGISAPPNSLLAPPSNFVGMFMVDTDANMGTYADASADLDLVGYGPKPFTLAITGDTADSMGIHDGVISGNFASPVTGAANGFDKLAAYGYDSNIGSFRWLINTDGTNTIGATGPNSYSSTGGIFSVQPASYQLNALPLAGNFDGSDNGANPNGDEIGLFTGTQFLLDMTPTSTASGQVVNPALGNVQVVNTALRGTPIAGDFLGNGITDLATYLNGVFYINFGTQPGGPGTPIHYSGNVDLTVPFAFPGQSAIPVAGDIYGDGIDELGLWVPAASGNQATGGQFYFLSAVNPSTYMPGSGISATQLTHAYSVSPLGNDSYTQYGTDPALPLVGIWDPPYASSGNTSTPTPASLGVVQAPLVTSSSQSWLSVTPARDGYLEVSVGAANAGTVEASLYDSNYDLLSSGTVDSNGNLTFATPAVAGQTYLIQLSGLAGGTTGSVTVSNNVPIVQRLNVLQQGNTVTPADALAIINYLDTYGSTPLNVATPATAGNSLIYFDTNMDGTIDPADALAVIDYLNANPAGVAPQVAPAVAPQAVSPAAPITDPSTPAVTPQVVSADPASAGSSASSVGSDAGLGAAVIGSAGPPTPSTSVVNAAVTALFQQSAAPVTASATTTSTSTTSASSGTSTSATLSTDGTASIDAALGDSTDWLD